MRRIGGALVVRRREGQVNGLLVTAATISVDFDAYYLNNKQLTIL